MICICTFFFYLLSIGNDNSSNYEHQKESLATKNVEPSTTITSNSATPNRSILDAISIAIDNHMRPSIRPTNQRKKQIDRPYGESITSFDAYMKIKAKENSRKKRSNKENDVKNEKKRTKQTRW